MNKRQSHVIIKQKNLKGIEGGKSMGETKKEGFLVYLSPWP